jgi:MoaA/NifB/PqqE/SkfB family radical SAM enzyme
MTTNANLINEERARMIVEGGVSHLFVSIDSSDPEIYASMRVLGNLSKVEAALEAINRWKDRLNSPTPTMTLASTFMERNVRTMPDLLDFGVRHRFNSYSIQLMEVENIELESEFLGHHMPLAKEMLLETLRRSEGKPIEVKVNIAFRNLLTHMLSLPEARMLNSALEGGPAGDTADQPMDPESPLASLSTKSKHLTEKCHYPWYMLLIDTDGDSRPCCWAGSSYGNLNNRSLEEVWNGPATIQMRKDFLNNHIPRGCQNKHCRVDLDHDGTMAD